MTSSLDMIRGRSNVVTLTNNSGGALVAGDVCIQDTSADEKVTTTTSAASVLKIFVAAEAIANGATGRFYESGYCPLVNVNASVTRGRFLFTHTVAKQAAENATYGAGAFGKILKSGTTPSAIIYSATAQVSGSGVTRSGSTTDNHLAVWNGSDADSLKDGGTSSGAPTDATYITTTANGSLSAEIVIPCLAASQDILKGGANDDDFATVNGSAITGWTSFGTPDASDESTTALSHAYVRANAAASDNWKGYIKAHGAGTAFTVIAKLTSTSMSVVGPRVYGIFLSHGAPGKMAGIQIENSSSVMQVFGGRIWTNATTYGSDALSGIQFSNKTTGYQPALWFKMIVASSSSVTSFFSEDGLLWRSLGAAWDTTLGAGNTDYIGIGVDSNSASLLCEGLWDYVRFS